MKKLLCGLVLFFAAFPLFAQFLDTWEVYELAIKTTEVDQRSGEYARLAGGSGRNLLVVNTEENYAVLIGLESMKPQAMQAQVETVRFPAAGSRQGLMESAAAERNIFSLRLETVGFGEALLLGTETISRKAGKAGQVSEKRSVSLRGVGIDYDPADDLDPEYEYNVNSARYNQSVSDRMNRSVDPLQPLYEYVAGKTGLNSDLAEVDDLIGWAFDAVERLEGPPNGDTLPVPAGTLAGTKWLLTAWSDSSSDPSQFTITADFDASQIGGTSAVNYYGGPYTVSAEGRFSTGDLRSTLMGGSEEAMRAESLYFELLRQARMYAVTETTLTLKDGNNQDILIFQSKENKPNPDRAVLNITGTVVWKPLEGGFFAIDADDGKGYDPINLPREYRTNGTRVRITAVERKDMASIHMYGTIIQIRTISGM